MELNLELGLRLELGVGVGIRSVKIWDWGCCKGWGEFGFRLEFGLRFYVELKGVGLELDL